MSKTFEQFRLYYAPEMYGIPAPLAVTAIREAIIQFCKETMILVADANPIYVTGEEAEYDIEFEGDYDPVIIKSAYYGERLNTDTQLTVTSEREIEISDSTWQITTTTTDPQDCFLTEANKVRLYPIPENDVDEDLLLSCVVAPTREATEIESDIIYNDHIEGIKHGALCRLLKMRGRSWFDPEAAAGERSDFEVFIAQVRAKTMQGKNTSPMTMSMAGLPKY